MPPIETLVLEYASRAMPPRSAEMWDALGQQSFAQQRLDHPHGLHVRSNSCPDVQPSRGRILAGMAGTGRGCPCQITGITSLRRAVFNPGLVSGAEAIWAAVGVDAAAGTSSGILRPWRIMSALVRRGLDGPRRSGLLGNGLWALLDQGLRSAANFALMVVLARALGPAELGSFTLVYMVLVFGDGLQQALVTQPHSVLGAPKQGLDFIRYTTATGFGQMLFVAALALVIGIVSAVAFLAGSEIAPLLAALAPAIVTWQLQEFVRRVLYTKAALSAAFKTDLISYGGQVLGAGLLAYHRNLTAQGAIVVLGLSSAGGALYGAWKIRHYLVWSLCGVRASLVANWQFGKWLLGTNIVSWTSIQLYPVLTAGFVGVAATGAVRAMQTILGPTYVLTSAMMVFFTPRAAVAYAEGQAPALRAFLRSILLITAPGIGAFCVAVAIFAQPLIGALYGDDYTRYSWLLVVFSLVYALGYLNTVARIVLQAAGATAPIFRAYLGSTFVVLTLGIAVVLWFGLAGAALGMVTHAVMVNLVLWKHVRQKVG